jgi:hypothetical protein
MRSILTSGFFVELPRTLHGPIEGFPRREFLSAGSANIVSGLLSSPTGTIIVPIVVFTVLIFHVTRSC